MFPFFNRFFYLNTSQKDQKVNVVRTQKPFEKFDEIKMSKIKVYD